jgi:PKHD-type hydroxylase
MYSDFLENSLGKKSCLDSYYFFPKGFSEEEVNKIISYEKDGSINTKEGTTFSGNSNDSVRKSEVGWIPHNQQFHWVYERMGRMVAEANDKMWNFHLAGMSEQIQYAVYPPNGGHYDWHIDMGRDNYSRRKISITTQLTDPDEYEGGEVQLKIGSGDQAIPKGKGMTIIFPSYLLHRVTPVSKGHRRSLALWVTGPPFK